MKRDEKPVTTWTWEDYRQTALEDGDVEWGAKKLPPGPRPRPLGARPKASRPTHFSRG